jgi:flagellar biosynthesis chaperone FliJ
MGVYENVQDTTQWDGLVRKEIDKANGSVRQILSTMSPQAREFAEQQMKQFGEMQIIKMRSLRTKTAASQNLTMLMSIYEMAIAQGNDQLAELAKTAMDSMYGDWYGSEAEYKAALKDREDRGIQEYNQNQLNIVRDEVAAMAELQTPIEDISQFIDDTMPDASTGRNSKATPQAFCNTIRQMQPVNTTLS